MTARALASLGGLVPIAPSRVLEGSVARATSTALVSPTRHANAKEIGSGTSAIDVPAGTVAQVATITASMVPPMVPHAYARNTGLALGAPFLAPASSRPTAPTTTASLAQTRSVRAIACGTQGPLAASAKSPASATYAPCEGRAFGGQHSLECATAQRGTMAATAAPTAPRQSASQSTMLPTRSVLRMERVAARTMRTDTSTIYLGAARSARRSSTALRAPSAALATTMGAATR